MGTVQTPCVNGLHLVAGICLQNEGYCDSGSDPHISSKLGKTWSSYSSPRLSRLAHLINWLLFNLKISNFSMVTFYFPLTYLFEEKEKALFLELF